MGNLLTQLREGRLRFVPFRDAGDTFLHVDDAVAGLLLVHDRGRPGGAYVLGGEVGRLGPFLELAAAILGRRPPRLALPTALFRLAAPLGPVLGPLLGFPPNLRELVRMPHRVTYSASDAKARTELGYAPRDLATGLRQTLLG